MERIGDIRPDECLFHFGNIGNDDDADSELKEGQIRLADNALPREKYAKAFNIVKRHLLRGDSYLCNLTCRVPVTTSLSLTDIYHSAKAPYKLLLPKKCVCFSPEKFVSIKGRKIASFPMKGTAEETDPDAAKRLMDNEKEKAEHATIVDLIRNDISRVATDVHVERYRYLERIIRKGAPLLQTSSAIVGTLPENYTARLGDILFQMLPAGSITGAPKDMTQRIIEEAEGHERGFYCGVMGVWQEGKLDSAVMIRLIERDPQGNYFYHAGGGITAKSNLEDEYNEVLEKIYIPLG